VTRGGSLFLDDHGALFGLCHSVGCRCGLLFAAVVFDHAFAIVDMPHVVFLVLLVVPSSLGSVAASALSLAVILVCVARPLAVATCAVGHGFDRRERALVAWAGLRGAVPIVLATFVLSEQLNASMTIFNAVFFVVIVSALAHGLTLGPLAQKLRLTDENP
jgi:potassium/hydrogen antiporter